MCSVLLAVVLVVLLSPSPCAADDAQGTKADTPPQDGRIVSEAEVKAAAHPTAAAPLRVIFYPFHIVNSGMESGLISFEKNRMRERLDYWQAWMRRNGVAALLGGLGEGTGFGLGGSYTIPAEGASGVRVLGRVSFKGYQEFDLAGAKTLGKTRFILQSSYQWRPQENFYGLGMDSIEKSRTKFALRQTWGGGRFEFIPHRRLVFGAEYRTAWLFSTKGTDPLYGSPGETFPDLPGFGERIRAQTAGFYIRADGIRGEYDMGGQLHFGASSVDGLADSRLKYIELEGLFEGRLPVATARSVLVAQGQLDFVRPRGGSDPIPFYLLPHIGGSSTLRGFSLDRFYGKSILLFTLEYRYKLHPNYQMFAFFDEGQLFDRTADLSWLNWQRNYGFGFKWHSSRGTLFRIDFGWSDEGFQYHINWGDRLPRPLGGPIRYGTYRR